MKHLLIVIALLISAAAWTNVNEAPVHAGCETVGNVEGICGFPAPEDIDVFDGGRYLLFSPVTGVNGTKTEQLYVFDTQTLSASPMRYTAAIDNDRWGDANCIEPPAADFSPHGVHISRRSDGLWQALVVNHIREAVEIFEVAQGEVPSLIWRGCALGSELANFNDVVALPAGGFLVSHMFDRGAMPVMAAMQSTVNTGFVWQWQQGDGFSKLKGSDGIVPNGLAVSADGEWLFMAETGGKRVTKLSLVTGERAGAVQLGPVDNLSWAADGRLIAAPVAGARPLDCFSKPGPCLTPFDVVAINPDTLEFSVLHEQRGKPMGTASIAVLLDNVIYAGSFKGHQVMRVNLDKP